MTRLRVLSLRLSFGGDVKIFNSDPPGAHKDGHNTASAHLPVYVQSVIRQKRDAWDHL